MITFLTTLFYLFGIFPLMFEIYHLLNPRGFNKMVSLAKHDKEEAKKDTGIIAVGCFMIIYVLWSFVGLATSQWPAFVILTIISLLNSFFNSGRYVLITVIEKLLSVIIIGYIIINHFHLHIPYY